MPFVKGTSGNPSGRPKMTVDGKRSVAEVARDYTLEAVELLVGAMRDAELPGADRIRAANLILDRGWGKPKQVMELSGQDGDAIKFEQIAHDASAFRSRILSIAAAVAADGGTGETVQ